MFKYLLLAAMWMLYCLIHSLLISTFVTRWVQKKYPDGYPYYRIAFNLFSILTLIPAVIYSVSLRTAPVIRWDGNLRFLQAVLLLIVGLLFIAGMFKYDIRQFLGLSQIRKGSDCKSIAEDCGINMSGVLGYIRHPWYTAFIILLWARDFDLAGLVTNIILTAYIFIGTRLEETKLIMEFGQAYRDYQEKVSMFFPVKWVRSKVLAKLP